MWIIINHFLSSFSFGSKESGDFKGCTVSPTVNGFWMEIPSDTVALNGTSLVAFNGTIG